MRLLLQSTTKGAVLNPSVAVSITAHLVLAGAAAYGTGPRIRLWDDHVTERVYYLPPPDRRPDSDQHAERVRYFDAGSGSAAHEVPAERGAAPSQPRKPLEDKPGGDGGNDDRSTAATARTHSTDSVYSILAVDETAARVQRSAAPVYPLRMLKEGIEGTVLTRFIIDSTGRVDSVSVEVLRATDPAFAESVRVALAGMLFSPAVVAGHAVRQLVEQRFEFTILQPPPVLADQTRTPRSP